MKKHIVGVLLLTLIIIPSLAFAQADIDPAGSVSSCISIQGNLRYRSRDTNANGDVSSLQYFLQAQNYLNSEPTGYFGLLTQKAVQDFQTTNGISPTGFVGALTRAKISALTCGTATALPSGPIACTMEARQCPDGSYVGRTGPSCEFSRCPTITPHSPCGNGASYNSVTGERCDTTNNAFPTISLISPNGGEVYTIGQPITVTWQGTKFNADSTVTIALVDSNNTRTYLTNIAEINNSGSFTTRIFDNMSPGFYKVKIYCSIRNTERYCSPGGSLSMNPNAEDISDGYITLVSASTTNSTTAVETDAYIKAFMANARAQAELYYDSYGNYAGVCTNTNVNTSAGIYGGIYNLVTQAAQKLSTNNTLGFSAAPFTYSAVGNSGSSVCHDSANYWAAITSLKNPNTANSGWCVDSTGASKEATSLAANVTSCSNTNNNSTNSFPTVMLTANPTSVTLGQSTTLTWSSTNATYCGMSYYPNIPPDPSGVYQLNGSLQRTPSQTTTYTVSCSNNSGQYDTKNVTVAVASTTPPAPTVTLSSPTYYSSNNTAYLSWTATNVTSCRRLKNGAQDSLIFNNALESSVGPNYTIVDLTQNDSVGSYSISCTGPGGTTISNSASVSTPSTSIDLIINYFTSSPSSITLGQPITLSWSATGAAGCDINYQPGGTGVRYGMASVNRMGGTYTLSSGGYGYPAGTGAMKYELVCGNPQTGAGSTQKSVTINVAQ